MAKHLFLEGPVQSGKSTLIKACIKPYIHMIGGFSCKRYVNEEGLAGAYGLAEPEDFNVDGVYDIKLHGNPDLGIEPKEPGIFLMRKKEGAAKNLSAFETIGVEMLEKSRRKKMILLDEIGGLELLAEGFKKELYDILDGDVPCIGVLKLNSKAKFMTATTKQPDLIVEENRKLHKDLTEKFQGEIISFDKDKTAEVRKRIEDFLNEKLGIIR